MSVYSAEVLADSPYVYYQDASAAPWVDDIGALDITITGATANQAGPLASGDTGAFSFDGTDDDGAVTLDLSDTSVLTVEFWLWWDAFDASNDLALEFTASWTVNAGSFVLNPSSAATVEIGHNGLVGNNAKRYPQPSAAAWHHYVAVHDFSQVAADEVTAYLDGALWTPDSQPSASNNGSGEVFANSTLNVMCRNGSTLFGAGDMAHLAIYKSALSSGRVNTHYLAGALDPDPGPALRFVQSGIRLA